MAENWTPEQVKAINEKGKNVIVSAAAGSGKTSVLSERVCRFVADGGDIERLLIVTFTNAASKEMRSRIRKKLSDLFRRETDPAKKVRLRRQFVKSGNARISTIDSFFGDLVRENFRAAEVSPNFGMIDETEKASVERDAMDAVMRRAFDTMTDGFRSLIALVGGDAKNANIPNAVRYTYGRLQTVPFRTEWLETKKKLYSDPGFYISYCCLYVGNFVREVLPVLEAIRDGGLIVTPANSSSLDSDIDTLRRIRLACDKNDWDGARKFNSYGTVKRASKKDDYSTVTEYMAIRKKVIAFFGGSSDKSVSLTDHSAASIAKELEVMREPVSCLFDIVEDYANEMLRICAEKNRYTFDMVTEKALRLLIKNLDHETGAFEPTDLALSIAKDFDGVMIDEYQDTSPIQDACFSALALGNMFVVGDLKQAIYGFRGASTDGFANKRERFFRIDLNSNFRSRKGILDFANYIFSMLFSPEVGGVGYDGGEWLNHGEKSIPEEERDVPDVEIDILGQEYKAAMENAGVRPSEMSLIHVAKRIEKLVSDGDGSGRKYKYSDIAVLLSKNSGCEDAARIFGGFGIPAFFERGVNLFESKNVNAVVRLLRALNDPYSDVDLYACMVCGIFDVEEKDIAFAVAEKGRRGYLYDKILAVAPKNERLSKFVSDFSAFRTLAFELPVSALVRRIYDATGYPEKVLLFDGGEGRYADLMSFEAFALAHGEAAGGNLSAFLKIIENCAESGKSNGAQISPKGEFVRIMTIHGSKGLEFPVCIIPELEKSFNSSRSETLTVNFNPQFAVGTFLRDGDGTIETPSFLYLLNGILKEREEISERIRVLYVAVTRAKEKLILSAMPAARFDCEGCASLYGYDVLPDNSVVLKPFRFAVASASSFFEFLALTLSHRTDSGFFNCADVPTVTPKEPIRVRTLGQGTARSDLGTDADDGDEPVSAVGDDTARNGCGLTKEELDRRFSAEYPLGLSHIPAKVSVTELAKGYVPDEDAVPMFPQSQKPSVTPEFLSASEMSGAERGTAVHRFVSVLDLNADPAEELKRLVSEGIMTEREAEAVDLGKIGKFLASDLCDLMRSSKKVYREEAFVIRIPAVEYDANAPDPNAEILLQGAIDALCETDGGLVLIDYKTDRKTFDELVRAYSRQIGYYALAAEKIFGKPVAKAYIWSFRLGGKIEVPLLPNG